MGTLQPQNQRNWSVQLGTAPCHLETSAADPHLVLPVLAAVLLWNRWASQPPRRVESDNGWEFGGSLTSMSPKNCHFLSYFCSLTSHNLGTMMFNRHGKNTNGSSSLTQLLNFQTSPKTEERDDDNILYISACLFFLTIYLRSFSDSPNLHHLSHVTWGLDPQGHPMGHAIQLVVVLVMSWRQQRGWWREITIFPWVNTPREV